MSPKIYKKNEEPDDTGITNLTDSDPMPFGKFQGVRMDKVSPKYLLWMNDNLVEREGKEKRLRDDEKAVMNYVQERIEAIELEAEAEEDE